VRAFFMVSQALMPKRCNVLLETVKELPPLQVLEKNGVGLCHDQTVSSATVVVTLQNLWERACSRKGHFSQYQC
jgi:hypothetical protein